MKKILLGGMLCLMACMSCSEQPVKEDFITDCEKSNFVKTPRLEETMAWFQKLADYSSMVNVTTLAVWVGTPNVHTVLFSVLAEILEPL